MGRLGPAAEAVTQHLLFMGMIPIQSHCAFAAAPVCISMHSATGTNAPCRCCKMLMAVALRSPWASKAIGPVSPSRLTAGMAAATFNASPLPAFRMAATAVCTASYASGAKLCSGSFGYLASIRCRKASPLFRSAVAVVVV